MEKLEENKPQINKKNLRLAIKVGTILLLTYSLTALIIHLNADTTQYWGQMLFGTFLIGTMAVLMIWVLFMFFQGFKEWLYQK